VRRLLILLLVLVAAPGCGYSLAGRGSFLPAYIKTVGIPQLVNRTSFFDVEQILTEKVRSEFIGRGKYHITPEITGADAALTGEVLGISVQPVAFNDAQLASRYMFTLTMKVAFTDARTNEVLWSNDALTFREEYELSTSTSSSGTIEGASFFDQERGTVDRLSTDAARSVVTAILEAF
jgi:hypothetical protein